MSKIVGGERATKQSWGWIVSLVRHADKTHFCAGSILSSSWILTAAHCVVGLDASEILIHAGSNRLDQINQQRRVATIFSYPSYNANRFGNDIALIRLSAPLDMTDPVLAKICLPLQPGKTSFLGV